MSARPKNVVRIASVTLLLVSVLMVLAGLTVLKRVLAGWWFLIYWTLCFFLTLTTAFLALLELWGIRIAARKAIQELLKQHLSGFETQSLDHKPGQMDKDKPHKQDNNFRRGHNNNSTTACNAEP